LIASGANLSRSSSLRKLGLALQGVVEEWLPICFTDNTRTRDLQTLQSFMLELLCGFWAGNSMKMELAESFCQPLLTMLCRAGKFRKSAYKSIIPSVLDHEHTLAAKHTEWVEQESWKRLVYRVFFHDTEASMAFSRSPLVSPAELFLPFPEPNVLWLAPTPQAWLQAYTTLVTDSNDTPSPVDFIGNPDKPLDVRHLEPIEANTILVHCFWRLGYHRLEWTTLFRRSRLPSESDIGGPGPHHQELFEMIESARLRLDDLDLLQSPQGMLLELVLLNLSLSLEDVQLLAGLEGVAEAQRVYPTLQDWVRTSRSRQAIWHAGQIIRIAEALPTSQIQDFTAMAIYQASLALWAYSVLLRSSADTRGQNETTSSNKKVANDTITLNDKEPANMRRFIVLDRGVPALLDRPSLETVPITDMKRTLGMVLRILRENHDNKVEKIPPLLENLMQLMTTLSKAYESTNAL